MHLNHEHVSRICSGSYYFWTKFLNLFKFEFNLSKIQKFAIVFIVTVEK